MDELEELQRLLGAVQKQEAKNRLNERNCRDLLVKLIEKELVQLITTLDGREYVTPDQVERELRDEIIVHGGRVALTTVQQAINVDLRHVQTRMDLIMSEDSSFRIVDGDVLTSDYLDGVAEEISQILQEAGSLRLVEMASRFSIPTQFLIDALTPRMGAIVQGKMESGMLYTSSYIERQEATIRGAFTGLTRPTPVSSLQAEFGFDESLFDGTFEKLVQSGRLKGALSGRGMRATYTPSIFAKSQLRAVTGFFQQNGYIEYQTAERMLINNPKTFLSKEFGSLGVPLKSCFVANTLIQQVDAQVEDVVRSSQWVDVMGMLPPFIGDEEAAMLLQKCECLQADKATQIMCESVVVSGGWIDKAVAYIQKRANDDADRLSQALKAEMHDAAEAADEDWDDEPARGKKKKGGKKKDDEEEPPVEEEAGGKKGKGSKRDKGGGGGGAEDKGGKGKGKGGKGGGAEGGKGGGAGGGKGGKGFDYDAETEGHVKALLADSQEEVKEGLAEELVGALRSRAREAYKAAAASLFSSGAERRNKREALQAKFLVLYHQLCAFRKGVELFEDKDRELFDKYLLKTVCSEITNLIFSDRAEWAGHKVDGGFVSSAEERTAVLGALPSSAKSPLASLCDSLSKKSSDDFMAALEKVEKEVGIECKPLDKNSERSLVFGVRQQWAEQLKAEREAPLVLLLTLQLLVLHTHKQLVSAPGRGAGAMLDKLKDTLAPDASQQLGDLQKAVVKILSGDEAKEEAELEAVALADLCRAMAVTKEGLAAACLSADAK